MGEENESVRGRRDPSGLFAVEIVCVFSVFDVGNKEKSYHISMEQDRSWMYDRILGVRVRSAGVRIMLRGEGADLGVHRADAVAGGLRLEESLLRHVQLPDSDAEWRIRLRFAARHASPTATTASCSVTDSPIAA
ncbi:hypothetical protein PIB30_077202 [Stylosanthes scabra]|uniref:Uncharacterized protein n=1 Tax=Stylosanthes scabra TaxID=79078 RepID=A0ABU6UP92_9FABA|nr:hypothetical protein [Stylosanthes scabra]